MRTILLISIFLFTLTSCGTSRKSVKTTQESEVKLSTGQFAKDSSIIEYFLDTTSREETEVVFNRIEYFPTIVTDSVGGIVAKKQAVKSVQSLVVHRDKKKSGKTEARADQISILTDSTHAEQTIRTNTEVKTREISPNWLLIAIVIALVSISIYIKNR